MSEKVYVIANFEINNPEEFRNYEKGFFGIAYLMSVFSSIAVQKNTRDIALLNKE